MNPSAEIQYSLFLSKFKALESILISAGITSWTSFFFFFRVLSSKCCAFHSSRKERMKKLMTEREIDAESRGRMITAELAILRELAFRRKVFLLRSQHDDGLEKKEKGLAPLQENQERPTPQSSLCMSPSQIPGPSPPSSSSPRLSGIKRPTPTSTADAECSSPELPQSLDSHPEHAIQADSNFCSICHVPCSSAFNYNQHLKGRKHKAKLQELKLDGNSFGEDGKVANRKGWCMDGNSFKMHLAQKHLEERNKTELTAKSLVKVGEKQTWCRLCNIGFSSEELFRLHLNAKKHKALQRAKCTLKGDGEQKWCKLCDVWCPNGDAFKMHLDGKNHILRLYEIEKNRRAENLGSYSGKA